MASTTQDKLYQTFVAVAGQQDSNPGGALDSGEEIAASLSDTVKQLSELQGSEKYYLFTKPPTFARPDNRYR